MKNWFQEAWTELKTGKKVKHRIVIDPEELERIKKEQKERQEGMCFAREEHGCSGRQVEGRSGEERDQSSY